eukprot:TRINITY_DN11265_c0_g1_i9.p1 TRINITY_DN11265_c0_g1~~TRINITY_DN11265_c0_g1_i9.p1  ORF type:complete len:259 (-),score=103.19 TRINITY_DN11265_c0_g1_i9:976-1752(-)
MIGNKLSEEMNHILYRKINLYELEDGAVDTDIDRDSKRETDAHSAVGVLVGKLTLFEDFTEDIYGKYNELSLEQVQAYERLFYFVKKNCNGEFYYVIEDSCSFIRDYAGDMSASEEFTAHLLNYIILGVAIASALVLMPYTYRAQQSILEILILFLNIDKKEIKQKIEHYKKMLKDINTHFKKIKEQFRKTEFTIDRSRFVREETIKSPVKKISTDRSNEKQEEDKQNEDEEKEEVEKNEYTELLETNMQITDIKTKK